MSKTTVIVITLHSQKKIQSTWTFLVVQFVQAEARHSSTRRRLCCCLALPHGGRREHTQGELFVWMWSLYGRYCYSFCLRSNLTPLQATPAKLYIPKETIFECAAVNRASLFLARSGAIYQVCIAATMKSKFYFATGRGSCRALGCARSHQWSFPPNSTHFWL